MLSSEKTGDFHRIAARAYAKINLGLEVLGPRPDGLHEVATILQTIDLADHLRFRSSDTIALSCRGMPASPDNLIVQAAHLLREKAGVADGCAIACTKSIPVAGGLGGGSADAATTLRILRTLWRVHVDEDSLLDLAASLGADVPFALRGGTALATGTGRALSWLPGPPRHWVVLVPLASSDDEKTGHMYALLGPGDFTDGSAVLHQTEAIRSGQVSYGEVQSVFTRSAAERWPATAKALGILGGLAAKAVSVSGTGPSVFGLYPKRGPAITALQQVRADGLPGRLCRFVRPTRPI